MNSRKLISIGVPCYNEEENIELMYKALIEQIEKLPQYDFEIIFEDNDSTDSSQEILRRIAGEDKRVKVVLHQTNFGPNRSAVNIYKNCSGDAIIGIPCDFQEPPEMIPEFISEWEKGYDVVWGQKVSSKESKIKYLCRKIFYGIINGMSDHKQLDQVTGFGLTDKKVIDIAYITQSQDVNYHLRNIICEYGFKIKLIPYVQRERERGKSSYKLNSYFDFAVTSLVNTSVKPLRMMTVLGLGMSFLCFMVAIFYLIYKIMHWDTFNAGMAPVLIGLFFVSGVQLFCLGMIGEYISVLIRRVTHRPVVVEKEKLNFDDDKLENDNK